MELAKKYQKFSPEFREEIVKLVVEGQQSVAKVAREHGLSETTVGNWVRKYREEHAEDEPPLQIVRTRAAARVGTGESGNGDGTRIPEKSGGVLREGAAVSEKYAFIAAEHAGHAAEAPTVAQMTRWLGVSKSGYYEWAARPPSAAEKRREELKIKIATLFDSFDGTYGYRRIHAELVRAGEYVGDELVRKLMRELNLVAVQPKPYKRTTIPGEPEQAVADLVARDFTAQAPGVKCVGDITYIKTWEGWLYLATVIDCFNKEVIGYAMAEHMRTELVTDALAMATRNHQLEDGAIMHSDRGTQYMSAEYSATLEELRLRQSVGRTGQCWDNALAESFFASLKNERVHHMVYPTRKAAKEDIARYIELFYNRRRIHSALGYRTPHEVRIEYMNSQLAA